MNAETTAIEPDLDLAPGQTREQALRLRAIMDAQGKPPGSCSLEKILAVIDKHGPLWETEEEREKFLEFVRSIRSSSRREG